MKTVISVAVAFALVLSVVPAIAGDSFQALSGMPAGEQTLLTPLSDEQLATIEGAAYKDGYGMSRYGKKHDCCPSVGVNIAKVEQTNVSFISQSNR
jgi:hypothetical protein